MGWKRCKSGTNYTAAAAGSLREFRIGSCEESSSLQPPKPKLTKRISCNASPCGTNERADRPQIILQCDPRPRRIQQVLQLYYEPGSNHPEGAAQTNKGCSTEQTGSNLQHNRKWKWFEWVKESSVRKGRGATPQGAARVKLPDVLVGESVL